MLDVGSKTWTHLDSIHEPSYVAMLLLCSLFKGLKEKLFPMPLEHGSLETCSNWKYGQFGNNIISNRKNSLVLHLCTVLSRDVSPSPS